MRMKKNKNGFTLVELLAVIVILAVIILIASGNVLSQMDRGRKNALAAEGNTLIKESAIPAYQLAILDGRVTTGSACFSLEYLYQEGYFSKGKKDGYSGSVLVQPDAEGKVVSYTFWISNSSYVVTGATGTTGKDAVAGTSASTNCGGASVGTSFKGRGE